MMEASSGSEMNVAETKSECHEEQDDREFAPIKDVKRAFDDLFGPKKRTKTEVVVDVEHAAASTPEVPPAAETPAAEPESTNVDDTGLHEVPYHNPANSLMTETEDKLFADFDNILRFRFSEIRYINEKLFGVGFERMTNFKVSKFQSFKISKIRNFKMSKFQCFKISHASGPGHRPKPRA